ncbi:DUF1450 domain-containing protein [Tumebacillus flagellatus]|uniref:UDP-N-acetylmuramoylalanine--D-glutamate ligase n=1 Tax=Tumebacillus flagellatus TaxID=1157490 RepID=A0A074M887_9BACL|nr:DUF1450 domain-containing protein [Tumebacillus flagellatus]KEO82187.1 hypothetical protein EL26_16760 [Tumebacillus flagellatus]
MSLEIKKIDVCIGNTDKGTDWVLEELKKEHPELKGQRWGCLGNCGNCYKKLFVMANNRHLIEADTKEELLETLKSQMAENN